MWTRWISLGILSVLLMGGLMLPAVPLVADEPDAVDYCLQPTNWRDCSTYCIGFFTCCECCKRMPSDQKQMCKNGCKDTWPGHGDCS
jgi:hypothetical protein